MAIADEDIVKIIFYPSRRAFVPAAKIHQENPIMNRRLFALLSILVIASMALAACGNGNAAASQTDLTALAARVNTLETYAPITVEEWNNAQYQITDLQKQVDALNERLTQLEEKVAPLIPAEPNAELPAANTGKMITRNCYGTNQGASYSVAVELPSTCAAKLTAFADPIETFNITRNGKDINLTIHRENGTATFVVSGADVKASTVTLIGVPRLDQDGENIGTGTITSTKKVDTVEDIQPSSTVRFTATITLQDNTTLAITGESWFVKVPTN